jgi:DNA-binding beta-propeller fold protein YncE
MISGFRRYAPSICVAAAMLAGCGGSQPPIGALRALPQNRAAVTHTDRSGSWMAAGAAKWDLLYVSNGNGAVTVYRYWKRDLVGKLSGFTAPTGECVDAVGNIFIADADAHDIVEYAHGARSPMRVLQDGKSSPYGCSVDPTTGNLAVANFDGNVALYRHASGKPRIYSTQGYAPSPLACTYNDRGNLLVTGSDSNRYSYFAELDKHSVSFIHVNPSPYGSSFNWILVEGIPWDGKEFAIGEDSVWRFKVKGDGQAIYKGFTPLYGTFSEAEYWIPHFQDNPKRQGTQIVGVSQTNPGSVMYWNYPSGGAPIATITDGVFYPYGVTMSPKL